MSFYVLLCIDEHARIGYTTNMYHGHVNYLRKRQRAKPKSSKSAKKGK